MFSKISGSFIASVVNFCPKLNEFSAENLLSSIIADFSMGVRQQIPYGFNLNILANTT
ncbi:hypothetical protein [Pseudoalteromonas ruthenica]|uniref:hypothetical protein n=1 Tax=Pseudoalteromonas ruthenica TaxID=151081 RepID=UPI001486F9CE|nr:hypothetical protein [Pseudoalteromonas ruthenica]